MLTAALRQLWLPGILNVTDCPIKRLSDWVGAGQYYFDGPVGPDAATFVLTPGLSLQHVFAGEIVRFASAAIETAVQVEQHLSIPQSLGWLIIQNYYGAFFSAHALLRTAGVACTQFDGPVCAKVGEVADALGMKTAPLNGGSYRCEYMSSHDRIVSVRKSGSKGGVHEDFWRVFHAFIKQAADTIMRSTTLPSPEAQSAAAQLEALSTILTMMGCNGGNWLSMIRNQVNYSHKHDVWFPAWSKRQYCDSLFRLQGQWREAPDKIGLIDADHLKRFIRACSFLIALCRASVEDMVQRASTRKFFLNETAKCLLGKA